MLKWRKENPAFNKIFNYTKEAVIQQVENALVKRAMGYNATVRKPMMIEETAYNSYGKIISRVQKIVYVEEEQHIVPDTKAITFFLENMKPEQYRSNAKQLIEEINNEHHEKINMVNQSLLEAINTLAQSDSSNVEDEPKVIADANIIDVVE
jgi:uncharacterized protein YfkK (UPF0435 family)